MSKPSLRILIIPAAIISILLLRPPSAHASDVDRLLDLLVKKHVVTEQEAADLRSQIQADHAPAPTTAAPADNAPKQATRQAATSAPPSQQPPAAVATNVQPTPVKPPRTETLVKGPIPLKLSGYVQARWTDAVGTNNPFEIRRARFELRGDITPRSDFRVQVDTVMSPILLDAQYDWRPSSYAVFTIGQFKVPFSQESLISPRDLLTISRSAVVNAIAPGRDNASDGRDIGAMVEGGLVQRDYGPLLGYSVGIFNGGPINSVPNNRRKAAAMRLAINPFKGFTLAGDYYDAASGPKEISKDRSDLELNFTRGHATLLGEYLWGHDGATRKQGWYAMGVYRFVPRVEGLIRFDTYDSDLSKAKNRTGTYLGGINWYVSPYLKFQANYGLVDNQARTLTNTVQTQLQVQF